MLLSAGTGAVVRRSRRLVHRSLSTGAEALSARAQARTLLREFRLLGTHWTPKPPASDLLWGRGFHVHSLTAPHPLLMRLTPSFMHQALGPQLGTWLRMLLRQGLRPEAGSKDKEQEPGQALDLLGADSTVPERMLTFFKSQGTLAPCTSTSEEGGLRVDASSGCVTHASSPSSGKYLFTYNIRFTNTSSRPLRVLSRQYDFRDASGSIACQIRQEQPEAAGLVGYTPLIPPGTAFEFGSGVELPTPRGSVSGKFLVMVEPERLAEDQSHQQMEEAELMLRFVYFQALGTEQFYAPLGQLRFDADVPCVSIPRRDVR